MIDDSIIKKIKTRGYWRVNIRPLEYEKEKIDSLASLKKIISDCEVSYRGWPYPFIKEKSSANDFIYGGIDWQNHIEYWRFYQSLQFLHLFVMREDWEEEMKGIFGEKNKSPREPNTGLNVFSTIFTIAEIFEFTNRLLKKAPIENGIEINIKLTGTKDRKLFCYGNNMNIGGNYVSTLEEIEYKNNFSLKDFLINNTEIALNCCFYFFERFNFDRIPKVLLRTEMYKYVSKKPPEKTDDVQETT